VHLGFVVISLPNLALIGAMIVLFGLALVAPFPGRHRDRERRDDR
jgi:hypothetical protein